MSEKKSSRPSRRVTAADPLLTAKSQLTETAALLAFAAAPVNPSPSVKARLLARILAQAPAARVAPTGWKFSHVADDEGWVSLPFPGLRLREMSIDKARDTALLFIDMKPGAIFPDHDHSATERGLVLSGDLRMDGRLLVAGDFYEAAAGTRHERIASPSGCTGLLWVSADAWQRWRALAVAS